MVKPVKKTKLIEYLTKRREFLEECNSEIENKLEEDRQEICQQVNFGEISIEDPMLAKSFSQIDNVVGNTFRYPMLIAICSFLEESLKLISEQLVPHYKTKLKEERGNWLKKHLNLLKAYPAVDFMPVQTKLDIFNDIIVIRNSITHAWGADASSDPKIVKIVSQREWVKFYEDGFLCLDDQAVPDAIIVATDIIEHILEYQGQVLG